MARTSWAKAVEEVVARDADLARVIKLGEPWRRRSPDPDGIFGALTRAIVFQQLSGKAAATIHGRLGALVDGPLTPEAVLALPEEALRGAGLSGNKAASVRDLAAKVLDGTVPTDGFGRLSDDEIVERITKVRGIGRWTVEMLLLFELRRLDVWPVDDLGVRMGYAAIKGLDTAPTAKMLVPLGEPYRPFRSVVAWYCWRAVDLRRAGAI